MALSVRFGLVGVAVLSLMLVGCGELGQKSRGASQQTSRQMPAKTKELPQQTASVVPQAPATSHDTTAQIVQPPVPGNVRPPIVQQEGSPSTVGNLALQGTGVSSPLYDNKIRVALLLPLSGKNAAVGQSMVNAAQMAVFDLGGDTFELMPRDTGPTPQSAAKAAEDAIASGARLLIGPLFAPDVAAVKPVVQTSTVNMLALSSDVSLAESGAFVLGFAPAPMVDRVVSYAAHHSLMRFAALVPATPYGKLMRQALVDAVAASHGSVVTVETYSSATDIERAVKAVVAKTAQIDALFIPAGGTELVQVGASLAANGFDKERVKLLGSGLWDDAPLNQCPVLSGGWYAAADPAARAKFMQNYAMTYGASAPRIATLAYDATALAAVLARRGGGYDRNSLTNPGGFAGLDGIFRLKPQGFAERGLALFAATVDGGHVIDAAPQTFVPQAGAQ